MGRGCKYWQPNQYFGKPVTSISKINVLKCAHIMFKNLVLNTKLAKIVLKMKIGHKLEESDFNQIKNLANTAYKV